MKILVLIKAVPYTSGGYESAERQTTQLIPNPADMTALEEALCLRDRVGGTVTALTMGVPVCDSILRQAIACGANDAVLLTDSAFAGSDTAATSRILAEAVKLLGDYDLIFCGRRSTDGETGQVGPELAARLNRACCVSCTSLEAGDNTIRCQCLTDLGTARYEMALPAVVTFCNGINSPRLQSLSGLFKAKRAEIRNLNHNDLGLAPEQCGQKGSPTIVKKSYKRPFDKRNPQRFHADNLDGAIAILQQKLGQEVSHG